MKCIVANDPRTVLEIRPPVLRGVVGHEESRNQCCALNDCIGLFGFYQLVEAMHERHRSIGSKGLRS